jgi:YD repeat-containing protein
MKIIAPGLTIILFCLFFSFHACAYTVSYTYDDLYRLIKVDYGNGETIEYTYDAAGNRLTGKVTVTKSSVDFTGQSSGDVGSVESDKGSPTGQ